MNNMINVALLMGQLGVIISEMEFRAEASSPNLFAKVKREELEGWAKRLTEIMNNTVKHLG